MGLRSHDIGFRRYWINRVENDLRRSVTDMVDRRVLRGVSKGGIKTNTLSEVTLWRG